MDFAIPLRNATRCGDCYVNVMKSGEIRIVGKLEEGMRYRSVETELLAA
jgi:hypothetical protein